MSVTSMTWRSRVADDLAPVNHRILEPLVPVVLADESLPIGAGLEFDAARLRMSVHMKLPACTD